MISRNASVSLILENNLRHDFLNWTEFESFDKSQAERSKSLSVEVTVDIVDSDIQPKRFKSQVSIQNTPRGIGMYLGPISFQRIEDVGIPPVPIHASVEYNDFIVGKNILSTIDSWEKALTKQDHSIIRSFQRKSQYVRHFLEIGTTLAAIAFCRVFAQDAASGASNASLFNFLVISTIIIFIGHHLGSFLANQFESFIDRISSASNITITKGDQNHNQKILKKNKTYAFKSAAFFISCLLQIALGVAANPIWDWIKIQLK